MGMVFVVAARINRVASDSFGFEFFQFMQDGGQYGVSLLQDFVVPEGDNGESQVLQVSCPCFVISGLFGVLPAVYFDNQFGVHADEIEDVLTQRLLAAEAVAAQSFAAQVFPQPLFGRRHVLAQVSAVVHEMRVIMREAFVVYICGSGIRVCMAIHRKFHTVLRRFAVQKRTVFSGAPCLKLSVYRYKALTASATGPAVRR